MKELTVKQSPNGKFSLFCINPSDYVDAKVLAAGVAKTITVPADATCVLFACADIFYAKHGAVAAIPAADISDGSSSTSKPAGYIVSAGDTIGVISPNDCVLTLEFFK